MVPCPACKIFHHPMLNCRVAENQLWSGTLAEPWLSANKLKAIQERKAVAQEPETVTSGSVIHAVPPPVVTASKRVGGRPRVYADPEARRKERQRAYMKKWRAKK